MKAAGAQPFQAPPGSRSGCRPPLRRRRGWILRDMAALLLILFVLLLLTLQFAGFPAMVRHAVLRRWNSERPYVANVRAVHLRLPFGIRLNQARLYRRGVIGPAVMEADRVTLTFQPLQWLRRRSGLRHIAVEGGIIRRPLKETDPVHPPSPWRMPDGERGRIEFRDLALTGLHLAEGSADFRMEGPWLRIENGYAQPAPAGSAGTIRGQASLHLAERRYTGNARGDFNPHDLMPMADAWGIAARHLLAAIETQNGLPEAHLTFSGTLGMPDHTFECAGNFTGNFFQYREIPVNRMILDFGVRYDNTDALLDIRRATAVLARGTISGQGRFDLRAGIATVDISGNTSPMTPIALLGLAPPGLLNEARFDGPSRWQAYGPVAYRRDKGGGGTDATALRMRYEGSEIGFRNMTAGLLESSARYDGHLLEFDAIAAELLDGTVNGSVAFEIGGSPPLPYRFALEMDRIDFRKLITAAGAAPHPDFYEGHLAASVKGRGLAVEDWLPALSAEGHLRIRQGRLFRLPIFGGLSQILSRIIPGLDVVLMQTSARAGFKIADNHMTVSDARIEGEVFNVEGQGAYTFGGNLDFQVKLKLMKDRTLLGTAVRAITFPLSKLFEFRLRGSLHKPRWYPVNFSSDLLERLRGIID